MKHLLRGTAVLVLAACVACSSGLRTTEPTAVDRPGAAPPVVAACEFSTPLSRPATVYAFTGFSVIAGEASTSCSRYVLYDDGAFELQYGTAGSYAGRYSVLANEVRFDFEASSQAGPWIAFGRLDGLALTVHYNEVMMLSDFEDAAYRRSN